MKLLVGRKKFKIIIFCGMISVTQQEDTWRLTLNNAHESDAGDYSCSVTSNPGVERTVRLHVLPKGTSLVQDFPTHSNGIYKEPFSVFTVKRCQMYFKVSL